MTDSTARSPGSDIDPVAAPWWLPSPVALAFLGIVLLAALFFGDSLLNRENDGDVPRHIAHGTRMLDQGAILTRDPFSYTKPNAPIIESEYGFQVIVAYLYRHAGLIALGLMSVLLIAGAHTFQAALLLCSGVPPSLALLTVAFGAAIASKHWVARPHLVSLMFLMALLWMYRCYPRRRTLWLIPMFALWANIHPGWLYALVFLAILCVGHFLEWLINRDSDDDWQRFLTTMHMGICGGIGSLFNPHGIFLHLHLLAFSKAQYNLDHIAEWLSPSFHGTYQRALLLGLLSIIALLGLSKRRTPLPILLVVCFLVEQVLYSSRNKTFIGLVALSFAVIHVAPDWIALRNKLFAPLARFEARWMRGRGLLGYAGGLAVIAFLALTHGHIGRYEVMPTQFTETQYPIALIARARAQGRTGHLYTSIPWAGYIDLAWPEQKIFIDGSGDFFGDPLLKEAVELGDRRPGWQKTIDRWDMRLMLLRRRSPLALEVAALPGWHTVDCDRHAVLLARDLAQSRTTPMPPPPPSCTEVQAPASESETP
jgi:hypothetical protein